MPAPLQHGGGGAEGEEPISHDDKPVKSKFDPAGYDKDLVEALERDIVQSNPNVHWLVMCWASERYILVRLRGPMPTGGISPIRTSI